MKTGNNNRNKRARVEDEKLTVGLDVGDASTNYCVLNSLGEIVVEGRFATTRAGVARFAAGLAPCRIALEVGIHSPWMSRQLTAIGHEVIVAHARNVRMISESSRKDDRLDARMLARLARIDPQLLSPVRHRTTNAQAHMNVIRARAVLVQSRTAIINAIRGLCKSFGEPLKKCGAESVRPALGENLTPDLKLALMPLLEQVEALSKSIKAYEQQIENIAKEFYPETALLKQVYGVGRWWR
jgi:transposase